MYFWGHNVGVNCTGARLAGLPGSPVTMVQQLWARVGVVLAVLYRFSLCPNFPASKPQSLSLSDCLCTILNCEAT